MEDKIVFVDTSAFYALIDRNDPYHVIAYKQWAELLRQRIPLVITNFVAGETYTLLRYRLGSVICQKFLQVLEESIKTGRIKVESATAESEQVARSILMNYPEHDLSYTDAVSFSVIKLKHIPKAFTFDRHFYLTEAKILPQVWGEEQ